MGQKIITFKWFFYGFFFLAHLQGIYATKETELAKIGILNFVDETGTKNFGYMPVTLSEAIDGSLQKKFEYLRQNPQRMNEIAQNLGLSGVILNKEQAKKICQESQSDILIFGFFKLNKGESLTIYTRIYVGAKDEFLPVRDITNPVDNTLFSAVDLVAQEIANSMMALAKEETTENTKKEKVSEEKAKITVSSINKWSPEGSPLDFQQKTIFLGGLLGIGKTSISLSEKKPGAISSWLFGQYRFLNNFLAGGMFSYVLDSNSLTNQENLMNIFVLTANLGYAFLVTTRFMLGAEAVGGYYYLSYEKLNSNTGLYETVSQDSGLLAGGLVFFRYLLISRLSLESRFQYLAAVNKPDSYNYLSFQLGAAAALW